MNKAKINTTCSELKLPNLAGGSEIDLSQNPPLRKQCIAALGIAETACSPVSANCDCYSSTCKLPKFIESQMGVTPEAAQSLLKVSGFAAEHNLPATSSAPNPAPAPVVPHTKDEVIALIGAAVEAHPTDKGVLGFGTKDESKKLLTGGDSGKLKPYGDLPQVVKDALIAKGVTEAVYEGTRISANLTPPKPEEVKPQQPGSNAGFADVRIDAGFHYSFPHAASEDPRPGIGMGTCVPSPDLLVSGTCKPDGTSTVMTPGNSPTQFLGFELSLGLGFRVTANEGKNKTFALYMGPEVMYQRLKSQPSAGSGAVAGTSYADYNRYGAALKSKLLWNLFDPIFIGGQLAVGVAHNDCQAQGGNKLFESQYSGAISCDSRMSSGTTLPLSAAFLVGFVLSDTFSIEVSTAYVGEIRNIFDDIRARSTGTGQHNNTTAHLTLGKSPEVAAALVYQFGR